MIKKYHVSKNLCNYEPFTINANEGSKEFILFNDILSAGTYNVSLYQNNTISGSVRNTLTVRIDGTVSYEYAADNYHNNSGLHQLAFTVPTEQTIQIRFWANDLNENCTYSNIMLNTGSTALPYEPYDPEVWHTIPYRKYETATDTITSLPKTIIGDGQPISSWSMDGNMQVSGTPTPQNPITPAETGDKTANLFDYQTMADGINNYYLDKYGVEQSSNSWVITDYIPVSGRTFSLTRSAAGFSPSICLYDSTKTFIAGAEYNGSNVVTITANQDVYYVRFSHYKSSQEDITQAMLNVGQPMEYEPYGYYKIPILSNGVAYPVYLAEPLRKIDTYSDSVVSSGTVTRNVYKLVLNGTENWNFSSGSYYLEELINYLRGVGENYAICSHFPTSAQVEKAVDVPNGYVSFTYGVNKRLYFKVATTITSLADFKEFLAQEYANGTPVTIYYVLATAETESVTAPSIPTTGGEVSIDVDTTVKPSEVSLTYHGWHEHSDEKYVGGVTANKIQSAAAGTYTHNGITVTSDGQGRYHISGTNTENASITLSIPEITFTTNVNVGLFNTISSQRITVGFGYNGTGYQAWYISPENRVINNSYNMKNLPINEITINVSPQTIDCDVSPYMNVVSVSVPDHYIPYGGQWEIENP